MILKSINVRRAGYYGYGDVKPDAPFECTVEMTGNHGKVELVLNPSMSKRIVEIVADEVAKAGRATADAMVTEALTHVSTKALV